MLIVCPSCASSYSLTAEQLGSGRKLKCAACRHQWVALPADAIPEPGEEPIPAAPADEPSLAETPAIAAEVRSGRNPASEPEPRPKARKPAKPRRERVPLRERMARVTSGLRRIGPAAIAALVLVGIVGAGIVQRRAIVRLMPQTASLYAALGLGVNLRGLEFRGVRTEVVTDQDQTILVVAGEIRAIAHGETEIPRIQLSLRGPDGHDIYTWTADAPQASLQTGETAPFRARLVAPPAEARDVVIRFAKTDSQDAAH